MCNPYKFHIFDSKTYTSPVANFRDISEECIMAHCEQHDDLIDLGLIDLGTASVETLGGIGGGDEQFGVQLPGLSDD
jgi:hypothetical protein